MPPRVSPTRATADESMRRLVAGLSTKAGKIRALDAAGFPRGTIAAFLGVRYQHVRNVLGPLHARLALTADTASGREPAVPTIGAIEVDTGGRIALPASVLAALDVEPGDALPWKFEDGDLTLMGRDSGMRFAHEVAASHGARNDESWSDELIAERRREASKEEEAYGDG